MVIVGIDQSNAATGIGVVRPAERLQERLLWLEPILMLDDDVERSVLERIYPVLEHWTEHDRAQLWVEQAPPMMRSDVKHGAQASIGFAQGWLGGLIAGRFLGRFPVHRVGPSPWRTTMLVEAARAGLVLPEPGRKPPPPPPGQVQRFKVDRAGAAFVRVWDGCNHRETFHTYADLHKAQAQACTTCAAGNAVQTLTDAEAVRDAWKATACRFVRHFWPGMYDNVVRGAQARARSDRPEHRLAGVADACEAVGIALHGLSQVTPCAS